MILATKLFVPRMRRETVLRARLLERLDSGLAGKLVLISAPAGFGKTTLVTDWLSKSPHFAAPGTANAEGHFLPTWVSLDEGDNDPVRFFSYLVAALQRVSPQLGNTAQQMLMAPQPPSLDVLMTVLVNELTVSEAAVAVVLDDYHAISSQEIHSAVSFLVEHLPPHMRVIMLTRADPPLPLARLRVRREMVELRAADLRFTHDEVERFLHESLGRSLRREDITALEERTEGWIAGLQLAALSLREREDTEQFIRSFTGSHAFVVDYLTEDVLQRQSVAVQEFLFATAVLDRFCGSLCDAVRDAPAGDSQGYLERLEKAHLFLTPLDDERGWYRYHHLFGDLLRGRLLQAQPHLIPQLHRRASTWFRANGWPLDAVAHALAAQDFAPAAATLEECATLLLTRGETMTLAQWLDKLPAHEVRRRPRLAVIRATAAVRAHRLPEAAAHLQDAESALQEAPDQDAALTGEILAIRANIALNSNRLPDAIALGEEALAILAADQSRLRAEVTLHLGLAEMWRAHYDQAGEHFVQAARQSEAAGDLYTAMLSHANHGTLFYMLGQLRRAAAKFRLALDLAAEHGAMQLPVTAVAYQPLAELYYEWDDLAAAEEFAAQAMERSLRGGNPRILLLCYAIQARTQMAQGKADDARDLITRARRLAEERALPRRYANEVNTLEVKFWLSQGEIERAQQWVAASGLQPEDAELAGKEGQYRLLARVLVAQGQTTRGLDLLQRLYASAQRTNKKLSQLETLALTSAVEMAIGRERTALATLQQAMTLAEAEGYVRTFLDEGTQMGRLLRFWPRDLPHKDADLPAAITRLDAYAARLLAAWQANEAMLERAGATRLIAVGGFDGGVHGESVDGDHVDAGHTDAGDASGGALIEPLSERELEVLRLVAQGLSDRQVAARLAVVPGTVKRHLNNIYGKLAVHSRTQALARARQLALITTS